MLKKQMNCLQKNYRLIFILYKVTEVIRVCSLNVRDNVFGLLILINSKLRKNMGHGNYG
jgi:ABC-type long-subunit fatty acid transport system fused permease/ATPase subunit